MNTFTAPTESIEQKVIEYCQETLNLSFGDFWYSWFNSRKPGNYTLHITCKKSNLLEVIKSTFSKLSFVHNIISVKEIKLPFKNEDNDSIMYYIQFRILEETPQEKQESVGIEYIKRNYKGDIGAQMLACAFLQDSLNQDYPARNNESNRLFKI